MKNKNTKSSLNIKHFQKLDKENRDPTFSISRTLVSSSKNLFEYNKKQKSHRENSKYNTESVYEKITIEDSKQINRKLKNIQYLEKCLQQQIMKISQKQINHQPRRNKTTFRGFGKIFEPHKEQLNQYESIKQKKQKLSNELNILYLNQREWKQNEMMKKEDKQSKYLQKMEMLIQKEDMEHLLAIYHQQYQQEDSLIDQLLENQNILHNIDIKIKQLKNEIQKNNQRRKQWEISTNFHANLKKHQQKTKQLRLQLVQKQCEINQKMKNKEQKKFRQYICSFFKQNSVNIQEDKKEDGIQIWIIKSNLIIRFSQYIRKCQIYHHKEKVIQEYFELMKKFHKYLQKSKNRVSQDKEKQRFSQIDQKLQIKIKQLQIQYNQQYQINIDIQESCKKLFLHEKTSHLQNLNLEKQFNKEVGSSFIKSTIQRLNFEQQERISKIKQVKINLVKIKEKIVKWLSQLTSIINQDKNQNILKDINKKIKQKMNQISQCDQNLKNLQLKMSRIMTKFRQTQHQNIEEKILILTEKIKKLKKKKKQILSTITSKQPIFTEFQSRSSCLKEVDMLLSCNYRNTNRQLTKRMFQQQKLRREQSKSRLISRTSYIPITSVDTKKNFNDIKFSQKQNLTALLLARIEKQKKMN